MKSKYNLKENIVAIIIFSVLCYLQFMKKEYLNSVFMFLNLIFLVTQIAVHQKKRMVIPLYMTSLFVAILMVMYCILSQKYVIAIVCILVILLDLKNLVKYKKDV